MIKTTPAWRMGKMLRHTVTLHKVTKTPIGEIGDQYDEYHQVTETEVTYSIKGEIQPITLERLTWLPPGTARVGDAFGYFKQSYKKLGSDISVELDDYITCETVKYLVQRLEDFYHGNNIVFTRAYLRRLVSQ